MSKLTTAILLLVSILGTQAHAIEIKGVLVDAGEGSPRAGLTIVAEHLHGREEIPPDAFKQQTVSKEDGSFVLDLPAPTADYSVFIVDAEGHMYDGFTHLDEDTDLGRIELSRACELTGRIIDAAGMPLAGVGVVADRRLRKVRCTHYLEATRTTTDADGQFEFLDLSPGEYACRTISKDHAEQVKPIVVGKDFAYMEITLQPGCTITGRITTPDGKPVAGLTLRTGRSATTTTDEQGRYTLGGLAEGEHYLRVSGEEYAVPGSERIEVVCAPDKPPVRNITVTRAGSLTLVLKPEPGAEIPDGVRVALMTTGRGNRDYQHLRGSVADGRVTLKGVKPGEFTFTVSGDTIADTTGEATIVSGENTRVEISLARVFSIRGRVVDTDGNPLQDAEVAAVLQEDGKKDQGGFASMWHDPFGGTRESDETNEKGAFEITRLPAGTYEVRTEHDARLAATQTVEVGPDADSGALKIVLEAGLSISGSVLNSDGSPATGLEINVNGPNDAQGGDHIWRNINVDGEGLFSIAGLAEGKYSLTVTDEATDTEEISMTDVAAGTEEMMIRLSPSHTLTGQVVDETGNKLADAEITVARVSDDAVRSFRSSFNTEANTTDKDGAFTISLREGSQHEISAGLKGFLSGTLTVDLTAGREPPDKPLRIVLQRGEVLQGVVVDSAGRPVPNLRVMARTDDQYEAMYRAWRSSADEQEDASVTDQTGRFTVVGVAPGIVTIQAFTTGDAPHIVATRKILVQKGQQIGVRLTLAETGTVKGTFIDEQGKPVAEGYVMIFSTSGTSVNRQAESAADGTFTMEDVLAGTYTVMGMVMSDNSMSRQKQTQVTVKAGETATVTLGGKKEGGGVPVKGTVTKNGSTLGKEGMIQLIPAQGENGEPMEMGMLIAMGISGEQGSVGTDGTFSMTVPAGEHYYFLYVRGGNDEDMPSVFTGNVNVKQGQQALSIDLAGGTLTGEVRGLDGNPVAEAEVAAVPRGMGRQLGAWYARRGETDTHGRFTLEDVQSGTYDIRVHTDKGSVTLANYEVKKQTHEVSLQLEEAFSVSGVIHDSVGTVARHAFVLVLNEDKDVVSGATADEDGKYTIDPPLPAGTYTLAMGKDGYAVDMKPLELTRTMDVDATLVPGGEIEVQICDAQGRPLAGKNVCLKNSVGKIVLRCSQPEAGMTYGPARACAVLPTNPDGKTTISGLEPGHYRLSAEGSDNEVSVTVKALDTAAANLQL